MENAKNDVFSSAIGNKETGLYAVSENFNTLPEVFKEITEDEFWRRLSLWGIRASAARQIIGGGNRQEPLFGSRFEEYHFLVQDYSPAGPEGIAFLRKQATSGKSERPEHFFAFSRCAHEWERGPEDGRFNCYHQRKCKTCGKVETWDSSD